LLPCVFRRDGQRTEPGVPLTSEPGLSLRTDSLTQPKSTTQLHSTFWLSAFPTFQNTPLINLRDGGLIKRMVTIPYCSRLSTGFPGRHCIQPSREDPRRFGLGAASQSAQSRLLIGRSFRLQNLAANLPAGICGCVEIEIPLTIHQCLSLFRCQGRHTIKGTCYLAHPFHSKVAGRVSNRKLWLRIRLRRR
jgi:hypothetical protein